MRLRQSTVQAIQIGPFPSSVDGITLRTDLTINQAHIFLSKDGGAFAAKNHASGGTFDPIADGYYSSTLDATDTATVGELILSVKVDGGLAVRLRWYVVPASVYDILYGDGGVLNNISVANVNAQVVDALVTDTYAEPAAVPAATASLKDKIGWLCALARNKITQTLTLQTLYDDTEAAAIGDAAVSDDGTTAMRREWS